MSDKSCKSYTIVTNPDSIVVSPISFNLCDIEKMFNDRYDLLMSKLNNLKENTKINTTSLVEELSDSIYNKLLEELKKFQDTLDIYEDDLVSIKSKINTMVFQIKESQAKITQRLDIFASDNEAYAKKLEYLKVEVANKIAQVEKLLKVQADNFKAEINSLVSMQTNIGDSINTYSENINMLSTEMNSIIVKNESLQSQLKDTKLQITDLKQAEVSIKEDVISWIAKVETLIKNPVGGLTGFAFGDSSSSKSFFNIYADDINLVSQGKQIIGVKDGQPFIDGSVIRLDSSGSFYENKIMIIPRTKYVQDDPFPHHYEGNFTDLRRGFYLISYSYMKSETQIEEYKGISNIGYVQDNESAWYGIKVTKEIPFMRFELHKYGL